MTKELEEYLISMRDGLGLNVAILGQLIVVSEREAVMRAVDDERHRLTRIECSGPDERPQPQRPCFGG